MKEKQLLLIPCDDRLPTIGDLVINKATQKLAIFEKGNDKYINILFNYYVLSDVKIVDGDFFIGYQIGINGREAKHFFTYHDGSKHSKITSICEYSKKVLFSNDKQLYHIGDKRVKELNKDDVQTLIRNYNKHTIINIE